MGIVRPLLVCIWQIAAARKAYTQEIDRESD
jgi:hypothetical protein